MDIERNVAQAAQDVELYYQTGTHPLVVPLVLFGMIHLLLQVATLVMRMRRWSASMLPKPPTVTS